MGEISIPSIGMFFDIFPCANLTKVGRKSMVLAISLVTIPPSIFPGHLAIIGTLIPPS